MKLSNLEFTEMHMKNTIFQIYIYIAEVEKKIPKNEYKQYF